MINKPTDIKINTQTQQNFAKTFSTLSMQSSVPTSPSNCDSQKLFHRKPSFKYYQRKEKKEADPQNKICYISPQKSQIFKKYTPYRSSQTDLNSSYITNNSSEISHNEDYRRSFKSSKPVIQSDNSRSILNEINNIKTQDVLRTPKNVKNDGSFFMSPTNLKRMSFNRGKPEDSTSMSQIRTDFDKDFESLLETKNPQYFIAKKSTTKWFQSSKIRESQTNFGAQQQNQKNNEEIHLLNMQLNILKDSLQQLNTKYNAIQIQKNQLQDSTRLFLSQIKNLQLENQKLTNEKQNSQSQIKKLSKSIKQKDTKINSLQTDLISLQKSSKIFQQKFNEQQINQNYKALYFQVNEKLKYLDVENSILKKLLDQKKQEQKRSDRLQATNKKLLSKNKFLLKSIQELEEELENIQFQGKSKKNDSRDMKDKSNSKNQLILKNSKAPSFLLHKVSKNEKINDKSERQFDKISQNEIVSSGSLEFSFELSPQKSYPSSRFKQEKQDFAFRTPHKCFN